MVELLPVVMNGSRNVKVDWAPMPCDEAWIVLSGQVSDDDVSRIVLSIAAYSSRIGARSTLHETTQAIADTPSFVVGGGLLVRSGPFQAPPSCCCGLESWREWYGVNRGGQSPWLGHDPMPWVDCSGDTAVVRADEHAHSEHIAVSYDELRGALDRAATDISSFVQRLRTWTRAHGGDDRLVDRFAHVFDV